MASKKKETPETQTHNVWSLKDIPGIGPVSQMKLEEQGIVSYHGLVVNGPLAIFDITGLDKKICEAAVAHCKQVLIGTGKLTKDFRSGMDVLLENSNVEHLKTGCAALDYVMGGGFETKKTFEVYAEFGSGKTQLGLTLCVNAQRPVADGGLDGDVIFIDTENTFAEDRILQIASGKGYCTKLSEEVLKELKVGKLENVPKDALEFLNRIVVARAYNTAHQRLLVSQIDTIITEREIAMLKNPKLKPFKLIVMDSVTALFRTEYQGQGKLANKWQHMGHMLMMLKRAAETYNIVVYYTNQVFEEIGSFGDATRPAGGHYIAHASSYRFYLKKQSKADKYGQKVVVRMIDSPRHATFDVLALLSDTEGFTNPKEEAR